MRETEGFFDNLDEVLYHDGDQLRRLKGRVDNLNGLGFVKVQGVSKTFYINPIFVERVELREGDQ
jgi:hypothetical protein